ncbi:hypothetical protein FH972_025633 [Carpinus fangiana]|uniref:Uncharacterized protein n=1 Tax=Carpinus fangiana TaxID=176857 RepID=A0A5N6L205_9ROSI|nr:hypothetical protein FH972_025633 [Carpinus fangiana]
MALSDLVQLGRERFMDIPGHLHCAGAVWGGPKRGWRSGTAWLQRCSTILLKQRRHQQGRRKR